MFTCKERHGWESEVSGIGEGLAEGLIFLLERRGSNRGTNVEKNFANCKKIFAVGQETFETILF